MDIAPLRGYDVERDILLICYNAKQLLEALGNYITTAILELGAGSASWAYTGTDAGRDKNVLDLFVQHKITTADQAASEMLPYIQCIPTQPLTYINFLINVFNRRLQTNVSCFVRVCILGDGRITVEYD